MTKKYVKIETKVTVSRQSDYSAPILTLGASDAGVPVEEHEVHEAFVYFVRAAAGGVTVELGAFSAVSKILVANLDKTNNVTPTWRTTSGSTNDQKVLIKPGEKLELPGGDLTIASDLVLTASAGTPECLVVVFGELT